MNLTPNRALQWTALGVAVVAVGVLTWKSESRFSREQDLETEALSNSQRVNPAPIEDIFAQWSEYACWDRDLDRTLVAKWNSETKRFSDYFEVSRDRITGKFYARAVPKPKFELEFDNGPLPADCPLKFLDPHEYEEGWMKGAIGLTVIDDGGRSRRVFRSHYMGGKLPFELPKAERITIVPPVPTLPLGKPAIVLPKRN